MGFTFTLVINGQLVLAGRQTDGVLCFYCHDLIAEVSLVVMASPRDASNTVRHIYLNIPYFTYLTFWRRNYFFNFSTLCI